MNVYNYNILRYAASLIPVPKRELITKAWIKVIVYPLLFLYSSFIAFRDLTLYKLKHNSQVCYLQAALNDSFDNALRRIRIGNVGFKQPVWFSEPQENKEVWFSDTEPVWFSDTSDFINNVDFVVLVPIALQPNNPVGVLAFETKMSGIINYYKLFSKNYQIVWQEN